MERGDGCTAVGMCLMPLNCILKNGQNGKCYIDFAITKMLGKNKNLKMVNFVKNV